jgi:hypothetical protein
VSYAGLTKGFTALAAAMISGAARAGLADALRAELARSQPALLSMIGTRMPAMFPKADRWVAEMEEIAAFLGDSENGATIYEDMALVARDAGGISHANLAGRGGKPCTSASTRSTTFTIP